MKKILGLTIAALLVIGLVGGVTWAYFSDSEQSTNNSLTAGTLDLTVDGVDTAVTTFSESNKAPGDSGSGSTTLANAGSLAGELDIAFSAITNTPGAGGGQYEGGSGELGANAEIAVYIDVDQSNDFSDGDIGLDAVVDTTYLFAAGLQWNTIDSYGSITWDAVETMAASPTADNFRIEWRIPTGAVNDIQGDSVSFDVTFTLEQAAVDA